MTRRIYVECDDLEFALSLLSRESKEDISAVKRKAEFEPERSRLKHKGHRMHKGRVEDRGRKQH